jgi:hypothetical protein
MEKKYIVGLCPTNVNGNHIAWMKEMREFDNSLDAEDYYNELADVCVDTGNAARIEIK